MVFWVLKKVTILEINAIKRIINKVKKGEENEKTLNYCTFNHRYGVKRL